MRPITPRRLREAEVIAALSQGKDPLELIKELVDDHHFLTAKLGLAYRQKGILADALENIEIEPEHEAEGFEPGVYSPFWHGRLDRARQVARRALAEMRQATMGGLV